jgi:hypothetical protein
MTKYIKLAVIPNKGIINTKIGVNELKYRGNVDFEDGVCDMYEPCNWQSLTQPSISYFLILYLCSFCLMDIKRPEHVVEK